MVEIKHAVVAPPQRVQDVVGVFGAKAGEHNARGISLAVAVGVFQVQELGAVGDIRAAVARLDARGNQEALRKNGRPVGPAVVVAVFDDEHLVVGDGARLDLGVNLGAGDPEPAGRVEVDLQRLGDQGVGRE